jgi:hypothetical protein
MLLDSLVGTARYLISDEDHDTMLSSRLRTFEVDTFRRKTEKISTQFTNRV